MGVREEAKGKGTLSSPVLQQFLRASVDTTEDEAWTEALSCELSRWLSSSASSSGEKVSFSQLYPAVQLQVPNWGWGCSCCFSSPFPPEGLCLQTAWGLAKARPCSCSQQLPGSVGPSHLALSQPVTLLPHPNLFLPSHAVFPVQGSGDNSGNL